MKLEEIKEWWDWDGKFLPLRFAQLTRLAKLWCLVFGHDYCTSMSSPSENYYHRLCGICKKIVGGKDHAPCAGCRVPLLNEEQWDWRRIDIFCIECTRARRPRMFHE